MGHQDRPPPLGGLAGQSRVLVLEELEPSRDFALDFTAADGHYFILSCDPQSDPDADLPSLKCMSAVGRGVNTHQLSRGEVVLLWKIVPWLLFDLKAKIIHSDQEILENTEKH